MAVDLPFPPRYVVNYLAEKIAQYPDNAIWQASPEPGVPLTDQTRIPIVASQPSNTDEIWDQLIQTDPSIPLLIQYDRLMRFRAKPFYQIKKEQVALYLYGDLRKVNDAIIITQSLLDREDASAQDLNKWSYEKSIRVADLPITDQRYIDFFEQDDPNKRIISFANDSYYTHNINFHNFMVYQVDESRDVTELAAARSVYVNKIIIEYTYNVRDRSVRDGAGSIIR